MFRLPLLTKRHDVSTERRDTDGRWTAGGGTADRHSNPQTPSHDPDGKAGKLAERAHEVPHKLRSQVASFVRGRYRRLSARYGPKGAAAILTATVALLPVPVPGSSLIPIAVAEAVLAMRRAVGKGYEMDLSPKTILAEARKLLAELYAECGETHKAAFALPVVTKAGHYDESKHRRGQPKNRGQFASTGGGGQHIAQQSSAPRTGFLLSSGPSKPVKPGEGPPPIPAHQQSAIDQLFRGGAPKATPESDPSYKPQDPFRPPGTGEPPKNLGSPGSVNEARDQLIWLLGRASIIRQQGRDAGRMGPKGVKDLTLAINLASRLQHGFFKLPQPGEVAKEPTRPAPPKLAPGTHVRGDIIVPPKKKPAAAATPQAEPTAPTDMRHNPTLDAAFAEPPESQPAPKPDADIRANPLLESLFGESKPAAKPAAPPKPVSRPEGGATHSVKLPRDRSQLTVQHAARAVSEMGYRLDVKPYNLGNRTASYRLTHDNGTETTVSAEQLREMVYRGKKKTPRKPAVKSFVLPS